MVKRVVANFAGPCEDADGSNDPLPIACNLCAACMCRSAHAARYKLDQPK